jgi:RND superfamily putative drug exporter
MRIMGRWNWWLPKPLAKVLPQADFEGRAEPARSA